MILWFDKGCRDERISVPRLSSITNKKKKTNNVWDDMSSDFDILRGMFKV